MEEQEIISSNDYYSILDIPRDADEDAIKRAYKKLIVKYHPDKNKDPLSEEVFKKINKVYTLLSNSEQRSVYDQFGTEEEIKEKIKDGTIKTNNRTDQPKTSKLFYLFQLAFSVYMLFFSWGGGNSTDSQHPYSFIKSDYHSMEIITERNVECYLSKNLFENYILLSEEERLSFDIEVEKNYLSYLSINCQAVLKQKYALEHQIAISDKQVDRLERDLEELDFTWCDKYEEFRKGN